MLLTIAATEVEWRLAHAVARQEDPLRGGDGKREGPIQLGNEARPLGAICALERLQRAGGAEGQFHPVVNLTVEDDGVFAHAAGKGLLRQWPGLAQRGPAEPTDRLPRPAAVADLGKRFLNELAVCCVGDSHDACHGSRSPFVQPPVRPLRRSGSGR